MEPINTPRSHKQVRDIWDFIRTFDTTITYTWNEWHIMIYMHLKNFLAKVQMFCVWESCHQIDALWHLQVLWHKFLFIVDYSFQSSIKENNVVFRKKKINENNVRFILPTINHWIQIGASLTSLAFLLLTKWSLKSIWSDKYPNLKMK